MSVLELLLELPHLFLLLLLQSLILSLLLCVVSGLLLLLLLRFLLLLLQKPYRGFELLLLLLLLLPLLKSFQMQSLILFYLELKLFSQYLSFTRKGPKLQKQNNSGWTTGAAEAFNLRSHAY